MTTVLVNNNYLINDLYKCAKCAPAKVGLLFNYIGIKIKIKVKLTLSDVNKNIGKSFSHSRLINKEKDYKMKNL